MFRMNNKTGYTGIRLQPNGKYMADIGVNYKLKYLGIFNKIEDAIKARKDAEDKYFGTFAYKENLETNS